MQKYWLNEPRLRKSFLKDFENECRSFERFACYKENKGFLKNINNESKESILSNFTKENLKIINRKIISQKSLTDTCSGFSKKPKMLVAPEKNASQENRKETHQFSANKQSPSSGVVVIGKMPPNITITNGVEDLESQFLGDKPKQQTQPTHDVIVPKSPKKLVSILKVKSNSSNSPKASTPEYSKPEENSLCVITKVVGNAEDVFCESKEDKSEDAPPITLKKTNDITKIKGWRRKQFFVEKPTTIEFYSIPKGISVVRRSVAEISDKRTHEFVKNAFVSDSLDEFLNEKAELKINYDIPHLYAEYGIKLTSEDIVSRPKLSDKELKEVETRYCVDVPLPCADVYLEDEKTTKRLKRHSERIEEAKASKMIKLDPNRRHSLRFVQKQNSKEEDIRPVLTITNSQGNIRVIQKPQDLSNFKLVNKLIALVVYPGPFAPLHPVVQNHLKKIRSRQTKIDKNWANFAASAVFVNAENYKRCILPVRCLVKIEEKPKTEVTNLEKVDDKQIDHSTNKDSVKVIEELDLTDELETVEDKVECQSTEVASTNVERKSEKEEKIKTNQVDVICSSRASFDKKVAYLLAKKVRSLKYKNDTPTSIDRLKTLTPNTVEFIKLNFVKESFLTGYINIWYLSAENRLKRSRAFVSFSQTPPVPNAINLKSTALSFSNLPKIITEVVSEDKVFDANEYAILHCDGNIWEIHGSLNVAFEKNVKNVEQIFASAELPELKNLQEIAYNILRVKAVKWWVLDLKQQFRLISIQFGELKTVVSRKRFVKALRLNPSGFLPLKKDWEDRVIGAYVIRRLMPFVLIGPFYLLESHNMILKSNLSTIPFMYYGVKKVTANYPLKFFINSVIKDLQKSNKSLEGLWLYDKMCLDSTTYLEVVTRNVESSCVKKYSSISIEHGYSLSSLTNSSLEHTSETVKRVPQREVSEKVTVYLYFDIFELGFVEGVLLGDDCVVIHYPFDCRVKMESNRITNWFLSVIKKRIAFFPKNLELSCFITKYKEDLKGRPKFDKFFLKGPHVLTKHGIHYLFDMSEKKLHSLELDKTALWKLCRKTE